jgi:hypothetical protein
VDEELGFSPLITREQTTLQLLVTALEYFDGYLSFTAAGELGIKLVRPPAGDLPEVTDSDMLEKPRFSPDDWSQAFNETRIKFTDRLLDFKENAVGRPDTGARSITGEPNSQTLDRSWVTDGGVAGACS